MPFDVNAFRQATYKARQGEVTLPALAGYFDKDEQPVFVVKMLNSEELARAEEAIQRNDLVKQLTRMMAQNSAEKADAIAEAMGVVATDVPPVLKKQIEHVRLGVVSPEMDLSDIVKLSECHPVEFKQLHNKIMELSGQGAEAQVKRRASGRGKTSKTA